MGLGCVKTPGRKRRHVRISGEAPCAVAFPGLPAFVGLEVLLMGVPAVLGVRSGRGTHADDGYALIAARSGWMPRMFMTRVRL
jgi:hypothetical protein